MEETRERRLIVELVATAIASPLLIVLLALLGRQMIFWWLAFPFLSLTQRIAEWINSVFPPRGGGWFEGLGTSLLVEVSPALILIWMILFAVVKLIEKLIERMKRKA